jgi:ATP-dependent Clp protease ATP-binding subunit ClpA
MTDWQNSFLTQVLIRRVIILHGNVEDLFLDSSQCTSIIDQIVKMLKGIGYETGYIWDRVSGARQLFPGSHSYNEDREALIDKDTESPGSDYDMGDASTSGQNPQSSNQILDAAPEQFLSFVYRSFLNSSPDKPKVYILDWTHGLWGNANSLSEAERQWLMVLGKTLRESRYPLEKEKFKKNSDIIIMISDKLGAIPPKFYQSSSAIMDINIQLPSRKDREEFIKKTHLSWNLREKPTPGTSVFEELVDYTEGLTQRDIYQMMVLSNRKASNKGIDTSDAKPESSDQAYTIKGLISLYKYGEYKSPFEELNKDRLDDFFTEVEQYVKGQDHAIRKVNKVIKRAFTGLSGLQHSYKQQTPKGILFFVGPTGVGKTELAKAIARFLFGDEDACIRFDMSEFNHDHSDQRLVGAPPGYVGYEEGGQLTNAVKSRPFSVLLFDEIEKAHPRILDKFLQILEDGRLTDGKGETVSFSETIVVFTSNIGAAEVMPSDETKVVFDEFVDKVREHFHTKLMRPELLNRIGDNIVPFNFIKDPKILEKIIMSKFKPIKDRLKEKYRIEDISFDDIDKAMTILTADFDQRTGGRGILNKMISHIIDPLAEELFDRELNELIGSKIKIIVHENGKKFKFTFDRP